MDEEEEQPRFCAYQVVGMSGHGMEPQVDKETVQDVQRSMAKAFALCNRLMDAALEADPKEDVAVMKLGMEAAQMVMMGPMSHFPMMAMDQAHNDAITAQMQAGNYEPDATHGHGWVSSRREAALCDERAEPE